MMNSFIIDFFVKIKCCKSDYLDMGEIYSSEVESLKPHKKNLGKWLQKVKTSVW